MIFATPEEIAAGLKKFLAEHEHEKPKPDFGAEKMTVAEASQYIDLSYAMLYKWITAGKIPVHGKGRTRFVLKSELIENL